VARTPGVALPVPTYRTADEEWVSFDTVVHRVKKSLGDSASEVVIRATVQLSRHAAKSADHIDVHVLAAEVARVLRHERVLVGAPLVERILRAYVLAVDDMDVVQVSEG
jgi:hypothetical protein